MNQLEIDKLSSLITKLEEVMSIATDLMDGIETDKRTVNELEKYVSSSGNTTWKGYCEDGNVVYFRQSQQSMYQHAGLWTHLQEIDYCEATPVHIDIETLPDGDFHRIVKINDFSFEPSVQR